MRKRITTSGIVAAIAIGAIAAGTVAGAEPSAERDARGVTLRAAQGLSQQYKLAGTAGADHFIVNTSAAGRFVLISRGDPLTPISPPAGCRVDSSYQVSCDPGLVQSLFARLKSGRDQLVAKRRFRPRMTALGGAGADRIVGGSKGDTIRGGRGPDALLGSFGDDEIRGGRGHDVIDGGPGHDTLFGGPGRDVFKRSGGNDDITQ